MLVLGSAQAEPSPPTRKESSQSGLRITLDPRSAAPSPRGNPSKRNDQISPPSPRKQSPVGSMRSTEESHESSRSALWSRSMRSNESGASRSLDGCRSPEEPDLVTPKEQYIQQMVIYDDVESQFDHLLVSLPSLTTPYASDWYDRNRFKSTLPSARNSARSHEMSNRPSSLPPCHPTLQS